MSFIGISLQLYRDICSEDFDYIFHCNDCVEVGEEATEASFAEVLTEASNNVFTSASNIVEEKMEVHIEDDDFNLVKPDNLIRATNRLRQKKRPAEPTDLTFEINQQFLKCEDFVIGDLTVDSKRHLMFATTDQLNLLQQAKRWYLDGTFKVVRRPFKQLFSIHAFIQKEECIKQVPLVFVLMSRRKKRDYKAVFSRLLELVPEPRVEAFCLDFESGAWGAIKHHFPRADIKGCMFHWSQAVLRKVAKLGLKTAYDKKESVHLFIRKILALPFLPADHIRPAFLQLVQTSTSGTRQLQQLMTYLSRTWFTNTVWSIRQWSVFKQSIRTNNDVEGWHRRFNGKAGRAQLQFYRLVPALRKEAATVKITHRLVSELQVTRYQRETYKRTQERLTTLWERYDRDDIRTSDFLKHVGNLYAPSFPTPDDLPDSDSSDSE